jgi:cytochrome c5
MYKRISGLVLAAFLLGAPLLACSQEQHLGEKVATTACVTCHANLVVCTNLDQDRSYWENTVQRMVRKGMDITKEEEKAVVDYLNGLEPGAEPVCQ